MTRFTCRCACSDCICAGLTLQIRAMVVFQYDINLQNELRNALQEHLKHAEHAKIGSKTDNL